MSGCGCERARDYGPLNAETARPLNCSQDALARRSMQPWCAGPIDAMPPIPSSMSSTLSSSPRMPTRAMRRSCDALHGLKPGSFLGNPRRRRD